MENLILFIILIIIGITLQDLDRQLRKKFNNPLAARLTKTREEDISFMDQQFFNATRSLLLSSGFKEASKYFFSVEKEKDGYLEHFINPDKGMCAIISQTSIIHIAPDEDSSYLVHKAIKTLTFRAESYFDDQTHIITTSDPNYLDTRENVFIFSYPFMTPKQILEEHEKNILEFSQKRALDYDLLKDSLVEINERESKDLMKHLVDTRALKYKAKKEGYYLTLKGYFKYKHTQIKRFIDKIKKFIEYKVNKKYEAIQYSEISEEKRPKYGATMYNPWLPITLSLILCIWGIQIIYQSSKSNYWPKVKGEIISFTVDEDFDSIDCAITYKYVVDGKTYINDKVSFGDISTKTELEVKRLHDKYSIPGTIVDVYYDPDAPSLAVLEKGNNFFSFFPLIMGIMILLPLIPPTLALIKINILIKTKEIKNKKE